MKTSCVLSSAAAIALIFLGAVTRVGNAVAAETWECCLYTPIVKERWFTMADAEDPQERREARQVLATLAAREAGLVSSVACVRLACLQYTEEQERVSRETVKLMRQAAADGWEIAFLALSKMHRLGHGVAINAHQANLLAHLAAASGYPEPYLDTNAVCFPERKHCFTSNESSSGLSKFFGKEGVCGPRDADPTAAAPDRPN